MSIIKIPKFVTQSNKKENTNTSRNYHLRSFSQPFASTDGANKFLRRERCKYLLPHYLRHLSTVQRKALLLVRHINVRLE